jgi:hypothetical protein
MDENVKNEFVCMQCKTGESVEQNEYLIRATASLICVCTQHYDMIS